VKWKEWKELSVPAIIRPISSNPEELEFLWQRPFPFCVRKISDNDPTLSGAQKLLCHIPRWVCGGSSSKDYFSALTCLAGGQVTMSRLISKHKIK
jgi:hypothetical protein